MGWKYVLELDSIGLVYKLLVQRADGERTEDYSLQQFRDYYGRNGFGTGSLDFSVGHGEFEILERFLSADVKHEVEFMSLEF